MTRERVHEATNRCLPFGHEVCAVLYALKYRFELRRKLLCVCADQDKVDTGRQYGAYMDDSAQTSLGC